MVAGFHEGSKILFFPRKKSFTLVGNKLLSFLLRFSERRYEFLGHKVSPFALARAARALLISTGGSPFHLVCAINADFSASKAA